MCGLFPNPPLHDGRSYPVLGRRELSSLGIAKLSASRDNFACTCKLLIEIRNKPEVAAEVTVTAAETLGVDTACHVLTRKFVTRAGPDDLSLGWLRHIIDYVIPSI